jgi:hypothetical protein
MSVLVPAATAGVLVLPTGLLFRFWGGKNARCHPVTGVFANRVPKMRTAWQNFFPVIFPILTNFRVTTSGQRRMWRKWQLIDDRRFIAV